MTSRRRGLAWRRGQRDGIAIANSPLRLDAAGAELHEEFLETGTCLAAAVVLVPGRAVAHGGVAGTTTWKAVTPDSDRVVIASAGPGSAASGWQ
jgi:hypothetical protein